MSFGPELIWCWSKYLSAAIGSKLRKTEAADSWAALSFQGSDALLLSWDAQACGIAIAGEGDKKKLLAASRQTPPIVGALKKHLVGAELTGVRQLRKDKVLEFTFKRAVSAEFNAKRYLILEATERYSNLILTNEEHMIIETAKHVPPAENRFRTTLPGFPYVPPPGFEGIALEEWLDIPSINTITKIHGFGTPFLRLLSMLKTEDAKKIFSQFYGNEAPDQSGLFQPQAIGRYITFAPDLLSPGNTEYIAGGLTAAGGETTLRPLLNRDSSARRRNIEKFIHREIMRREKQSADINKLLAQDPEAARREAALILSSLWQIKPGEPSGELSYWDDQGTLKTCVVKLNPMLSPQKNAAALFAKYKKIAASQKRAAELLKKIQSELDGLKEQQEMVSLADDGSVLALIEKELGINGKKPKKSDKRQKEATPLPPHNRYDLGCALVFAGLSANGNRYVTFNLASPEDIWLHAQGVPGSHVILRFKSTPSEGQYDSALKFGASLAAWFSKARESASARVDYTRRKHVSAIKGGIANVTYREFKSITADPCYWKEYLLEIERAPRAEGG